MKWMWSAAAPGVLALTACVESTKPAPVEPEPVKVTHVRVKPERGRVQRVPLEQYVRGTMIAEFDPPSGEPAVVERMFEVQAVVARTYAAAHMARHSREGFDLCASTHCQLYRPDLAARSIWRTSAERAAKRTTGMVVWYQGGPARTVFHADCGGHTSANGDVWDGPSQPYLTGRSDDGPASTAHTTWQFTAGASALASALNLDQRTRVGRSLTAIRVIRRDRAGRALRILLHGTQQQSVRAEDFRAVLVRTFGPRSIRSTRFDVARSGQTFRFTGAGFGHGVGLCQTGAYARLRAGARPEQVLAHYYPGTRLASLR